MKRQAVATIIDKGLSAFFFRIEPLIHGRPITRSTSFNDKRVCAGSTGRYQKTSRDQQYAHDKPAPLNLLFENYENPSFIR